MKKRNIIILSVFTGLLFGAALSAAPPPIPNPDFTKGESLPEEAPKDWNLGATGLRGWMHTLRSLATTEARQVYITEVAKGSPTDGIFKEGDVLLGASGQLFSYDPRTELGKALTAAEATDGKLSLIRWRDGKTQEVTFAIPVFGSYSPTAPYNCPKSEKILERSAEALAERMKKDDYKPNAIVRSLNALGLLATGDEKYQSLVKREAKWAADFETGGYATWWYGYVTIFLAEYVIATGDDSVLPGLRRIAMSASLGQSTVGSWGHRFAMPDGRLFGYGMMNSPGVPLTIGLVLAREAGVDDPEVATAIDRSAKLLRFYIGKGSVPYGDHNAYMNGHEDNGKCGMAAVLFDQLGEPEGAKFFSKMSTAAHGSERDMGHTGNFFNMIWAMPGVARGGPYATGAWMREFGHWYFDLARKSDWSFPHQGPPQAKNDSYASWDATGVYLIAYAMPRKTIRLTGSKPFTTPPLDPRTAAQVVMDGAESRAEKSFSAFTSWSPIVRQRAAIALAKRKDAPVEPFINLLDSPSLDARLGACEVLERLGTRSEPAVAKLHETLRSEHMWLRVQAAEALAAIGEPAMVAAPDLLRMAARGPTEEDPRAMEQRYLAGALFGSRSGLLRNSMDQVDERLLLAAVRSGLQNEDGRTRGTYQTVYQNMKFEDLEPLLPDVHRAILEKSPSGIMFDGTIQDAGLELFSKNHVSEGIELIADYIRTQKGHGSEKRVTKYIGMLKNYGAHAQRAIPLLEKAIYYFENEEKDFPKNLSLQKAEDVRTGIREIKELKNKPKLIELNL